MSVHTFKASSRADSPCSVQEIKELQRENNPDMMAEALEVSPPALVSPLSRAIHTVQCLHQLVVQDNIFEWHFAVRGPPDSEFQVCGAYCPIKLMVAVRCCSSISVCLQGGIYHGRILLPPDYPFKPPSFMLLTPNGRFETGVKICLSISSHHPEHWQPSWSVRTALTALVAFLPSPGGGAIGSLVRLHAGHSCCKAS